MGGHDKDLVGASLFECLSSSEKAVDIINDVILAKEIREGRKIRGKSALKKQKTKARLITAEYIS